jgi:hypothetical protein
MRFAAAAREGAAKRTTGDAGVALCSRETALFAQRLRSIPM